MLSRAAPVDDDLVPGHGQHVGRNARQIDTGMRAEVADARLHVEPPVGLNRHQAVEADRTCAVRAHRHTDAANLRPLTLAGACLALVPLEEVGAAIERLLDERARDVRAAPVGARRSIRRLALWRIDAANRDLIESELLGRLGDDRLHDAVGLHRPGRPLLLPGRCVGDHGDAPPAHRDRLPDERCGVAGRPMVAHRAVRTVVFDDEEVERGDASVLPESDPRAPHHAGSCAADVVLFLAADAHHHRRIRLPGQQRWNRHRHRPGPFAAEAAADVFADDHDVPGIHADPRGERIDCPNEALGRAVQVQLAVLPIGHRRAAFHRLVCGGLHDKRLVDDRGRFGEARVEVTVDPLVGRLAHRQRAVRGGSEILRGPLHGVEPGARRRRARLGGRRRKPHVPFNPTVRAAGPEALDRIDHEGQGLEVEPNPLDRVRRGQLIDGRDRQDRLALVQGLVGQRALGTAQIGQVVGGENRLHARHGQRRAGVYSLYAGVREGAQQQLCEQHPVDAVVFGVFRPSGDLGDEVGRRVVPTGQCVIGHVGLLWRNVPSVALGFRGA